MEVIGGLAALTAAVLWSFGSFIFTYTSKEMGSIQLNFSRLSLASIFLLITIILFGIPFNVTYEQIMLLVISGFIGLVLGDTFLFKSFVEVGPRVGMMIMSGNPAIGALLAYLILGEVLFFKDLFGIILALTGIFLVVSENSNGDEKSKYSIKNINYKGLIYGFLAALGQAVGLIFAKLAFEKGDINGLVAPFIRIFSSVILFIPFIFILKKQFNPLRIFKENKKIFKFVILGSLIGPYLGISLSFLAIKYTKIGIASTLLSLVPIIMLPIGHFVYKEKITKISIVGAIISVIGCVILFI